MIVAELLPDLDRLAKAGCCLSPMLMLGAQQVVLKGYEQPEAARFFRDRYGVASYTSLDLADGDLTLDLNDDLAHLAAQYACVWNIGTIEHCWNVHAAFSNTLRAVRVGGVLVMHSPVGGWTDAEGLFNHGLQMTRAAGIVEFVEANGFVVREYWFTQFRQRGVLLWLHAEKQRHIAALADFKPIYRIRGLGANYRSSKA